MTKSIGTNLQNKAISIVVERENANGGKKASVSKAMRDAGYSEATAKNPSKLTKSKTWQQLMDEYLPDDLLAQKHKELIEAKNKVRITIKGEMVTEHEEPNTDAIARGLDMGYKLKGKYKPVQIDVRSFVGWTPQELEVFATDGTVPERFITEG